MQTNITKKLLTDGFLISVLLHLLLILSMVLIIKFQPEEKNTIPPHIYTPAYVYRGAITPAPTHEQQNTKTQQVKNDAQPTEEPQKETPSEKMGLFQKSVLAASREVLRNDAMKAEMSKAKDTEPMLLIGDESQLADPLIKLVGRALSANFSYPKLEGHMGMRGKVLVEMVLHPEGNFTDVKIIRSSNNQNFDTAALYAINKAPLVEGARMFVSTPKYFIVGFLFN